MDLGVLNSIDQRTGERLAIELDRSIDADGVVAVLETIAPPGKRTSLSLAVALGNKGDILELIDGAPLLSELWP